MASTNATLEWMTRQRSLTSIATAYIYAALLVAGPWIFTVLGIFGLSYAGCSSPCDQLAVFRSIVIYNSLLALVVTTPLAFFSGRYVGDRLYVGETASIFFAFVVSLALFCLIALVTAVPFYVLATDLPTGAKFAAIQNVFLIGVSWLLIPFLGAIRAQTAVLVAFGVNALTMSLIGSLLSNPSATVLLGIFNVSFAITDTILVGTLVRRFGAAIQPD